jgi:hypothetical protein
MDAGQKSGQRSLYLKMSPRDFFSSSKVGCMDGNEQGTYLLILMRERQDGFIPSDLKRLAGLLRMDFNNLEAQWANIATCFEEVVGQPNKLVSKPVAGISVK